MFLGLLFKVLKKHYNILTEIEEIKKEILEVLWIQRINAGARLLWDDVF